MVYLNPLFTQRIKICFLKTNASYITATEWHSNTSPRFKYDSSNHSAAVVATKTMFTLFSVLSIFLNECGGTSPFDATMMQTSITTSSLHGDSSLARRYVKNVDELWVLFTLAMCPFGVNSTTWKWKLSQWYLEAIKNSFCEINPL